jgi:hypothetical protein
MHHPGRVSSLLVVFCLLFQVAVAAPDAFVLDPILSIPKPWSLSQDEFQKATSQLPFEWTSNQRESARAAAPGMTLLGLPAVEVIARFGSAKLSEITVLLFGRGDSGELNQEKFTALVQKSSEALNEFAKQKFTPRGKDAKNAVKAEGLLWQTETSRFLLEYSFTREVKSRNTPFRAEFVRLQSLRRRKPRGCSPHCPADERTILRRGSCAARCSHGDVVLRDIPMVDQGQKGYCVVASGGACHALLWKARGCKRTRADRQLHADGGTSFEALLDALKKLSARLGCGCARWSSWISAAFSSW